MRCFLVLDEDNYLHAFLSPHSLESLLVLPLLLMSITENAEAPDALSALEVFIWCFIYLFMLNYICCSALSALEVFIYCFVLYQYYIYIYAALSALEL